MILSIGYNAGFVFGTMIAIEEGLMNNKWKCVISTNALAWESINRISALSSIRRSRSRLSIITRNRPHGRDGEPAFLILFYNPEDRDLPDAFIDGGRPAISKYEKAIEAARNELLGEKDLMRRDCPEANPDQAILVDLIEQKIIREITINRSKKLNTSPAPRH
ncbi:MAG: hypothetical protein MZV64_50415 [Ignavibacteriales bacterium]|nr:hypothetical protein [Ignavibacteriales bacterium]